jgi:hypothetical protein
VCGGNNECIPKKPSSKNTYEISLVWGLQSAIDRSHANQNDPFSSNKGSPLYDPTFDLTDPFAQIHLVNVCDAMNQFMPNDAHRCVMRDFKNYVVNVLRRPWPLTNQQEFLQRLFAFVIPNESFRFDCAFEVNDTTLTPIRVLWIRYTVRSVCFIVERDLTYTLH